MGSPRNAIPAVEDLDWSIDQIVVATEAAQNSTLMAIPLGCFFTSSLTSTAR
jgi:hypothetical protein